MTSELVTLEHLWSAANEAWTSGEGTADYEAQMSNLLDFLLVNPQYQQSFEDICVRYLREPTFDALEIVSYVQHSIRSPRVLRELETLLSEQSDPVQKTALMQVVQAFGDDWEDRDLYARYSQT